MINNEKIKVIFIPGNGGGSTYENFFPFVQRELIKLGVTVVSPGEYPDAQVGRESVWVPFIESLGIDENTILIGHSTGAITAMRIAETHKILGSVLITPYHTDLGLDNEKEAEYFDRPWNWQAQKDNQKWVIQFNSTDDLFIPLAEARFVHQQLDSEYYELEGKGHFYPMDEFVELVEVLKNRLRNK